MIRIAKKIQDYSLKSYAMKITLILLSLLLLLNIRCIQDDRKPELERSQSSPQLIVAFFQDVSSSGPKNAVVLPTAEVFTPYFNLLHTEVRLHVGVIGDQAIPLITLTLPKQTFTTPEKPDLINKTAIEKKKLKSDYMQQQHQYVQDSIKSWSDRNAQIKSFAEQTDSLMSKYQKNLVEKTDINTPLIVSEKLFNYTGAARAKCYIILNSDGYDSVSKNVLQFNKSIPIILVNAGGSRHSSLDSLVTITLESVPHAIEYTIHN